MNKHTADTMTTAALRDLDSAPETVLTEAELEHADATFAHILATPSHDPVPAEHDRPRRHRSRLLVPVGLVGAGAAMAALLLGGSALASWTPTPEPLTPAETSAAAATCRADIANAAHVVEAVGSGDVRVPPSAAEASLAERRGKWTYVLITEPTAAWTCLMRNNVVGQDPAGHEIFGSYQLDPRNAPTVARDRIAEMGSTMVSVDEGWFREGWLTSAYGYVGSYVAGVTVHTPLGFDVEASVDNGWFAVWWPSEPPSSENLDVMGPWSYTVTLADGSTRHTH